VACVLIGSRRICSGSLRRLEAGHAAQMSGRPYCWLPRTRRRTAAGERGSSISLTISRIVFGSMPPPKGAPSHSWVRDRTSSWSIAMLSRAADPERPPSAAGPSRTGLACSAHPADPNANAQRTITVRMVDLMADRMVAGDDLDQCLLDTRRGKPYRAKGYIRAAENPALTCSLGFLLAAGRTRLRRRHALHYRRSTCRW